MPSRGDLASSNTDRPAPLRPPCARAQPEASEFCNFSGARSAAAAFRSACRYSMDTPTLAQAYSLGSPKRNPPCRSRVTRMGCINTGISCQAIDPNHFNNAARKRFFRRGAKSSIRLSRINDGPVTLPPPPMANGKRRAGHPLQFCRRRLGRTKWLGD